MINVNPGLAKRDEQDAKPWQARYHPDGELHHWFQHQQLVSQNATLGPLPVHPTRMLIPKPTHRLTLGFSFAPRDIAWRFPLAFQIFFTLCIWCLCPFLPDSPRLLIRKGKYDEAREVLAALEGHGAMPDSPSVQAQFNVIKDILDRESLNSYTWWQLLSGRGPSGLLRRMILGAWMQAMNQISGKWFFLIETLDISGMLTISTGIK